MHIHTYTVNMFIREHASVFVCANMPAQMYIYMLADMHVHIHIDT